MEQLNKTAAEHKATPKFKPQARSSIGTPKPSASSSTTIRNFFTPISKPANTLNAIENQEKRSRPSLLLDSLDDDFNRKLPKKESQTTVNATEKSDSSSGT